MVKKKKQSWKLDFAKLTEDEAQTILCELRIHFGWQGTEFNRADVESEIDRPLTDAEWEDVQNTYEWRKGLPERTCEAGWDEVRNVISSLNLRTE